MENKNTLIFVNGTHHLFMAYVVAKQLGLEKNIIGLLQVNAPNNYFPVLAENLIKAEKFIAQKLNLDNYFEIGSVYRLWGKNKIQKTFNLFSLKQKIHKKISQYIDIKKVTNIIMIDKYAPADMIILSALNTVKNIICVSDGNPLINAIYKNFKLPLSIKIMGVQDYHKNKPDVYYRTTALKYIQDYPKIEPREIDEKIYKETLKIFEEDEDIKNWLNNEFDLNKQKVVFLLHRLNKFRDYEENLYFIKKVIEKEKNKNMSILIKPHPRDTEDLINNLKSDISAYPAVQFFPTNHYFSNLPIEFLYRKLKITKVITGMSASFFFLDNIEFQIYNSERLHNYYYHTIDKYAKMLQKNIEYV